MKTREELIAGIRAIQEEAERQNLDFAAVIAFPDRDTLFLSGSQRGISGLLRKATIHMDGIIANSFGPNQA